MYFKNSDISNSTAEGATTSPGAFTPFYGRVKGEAETSLLEICTEHPTLSVYSVRPGGVDASNDPDIHALIPQRTFLNQIPQKVLFPAYQVLYTAMISPTENLGTVLVDLASGNGEPLVGKGISGEGRTLNNVALRRLAGLS